MNNPFLIQLQDETSLQVLQFFSSRNLAPNKLTIIDKLLRMKNHKLRVDYLLRSTGLLNEQQILDCMADLYKLPIANEQYYGKQYHMPTDSFSVANDKALLLETTDGQLHLLCEHPQAATELERTVNLKGRKCLLLLATEQLRKFWYRKFNLAALRMHEIFSLNRNHQQLDCQQGLFAILQHAVLADASDIQFVAAQSWGIVIFKLHGRGQAQIMLNYDDYAGVLNVLRHAINVSIEQLSLRGHSGMLNISDFTHATLQNVEKERFAEYLFRVEINWPMPDLSELQTATIRVQRHSSVITSLATIGFSDLEQALIKKSLFARGGLILLVGPTDSGKTTTLASMSSLLDPIGNFIKEISSPVEYIRPLTEQFSLRSQVVQESNEVFKSLANSMVRKCPDALIVGEIRNYEDASFVVDMALAGTTVLTSMHAYGLLLALRRLEKWGIRTMDLLQALRFVACQRLLPVLCANCKRKDSNRGYQHSLEGCVNCDYSGYTHRRAVTEVCKVNSVFRKLYMQDQFAQINRWLIMHERSMRQRAMKYYEQGIFSYWDVQKNFYQ